MGQSATMSRFVGKPESRSAGKPESRSGLEFNVTCLPCRKLAKQSITFLTRYRSGGTPLHHQDVRAGSFAGRCPRDQGPPAVLGASRLFVLLVAARRWVLAGNTFWHARWDIQQHPHQHLTLRWGTDQSRTTICLMSPRRHMMISKLSSKPISSALLRGPVSMASGGKGSHPKALLMRWICLFLQRNAPELCDRKSITWWLILFTAILKA